MICPDCGSKHTAFNVLFSYENGSGEVITCKSCGYTWEPSLISEDYEDYDDDDMIDIVRTNTYDDEV